MAALSQIIERLDTLLDAGAFDDHAPNGLQVPGPDEVTTVVTGVSAHAELLALAAQREADLVLVHHGLFWHGQPREIDAAMHRRLGLLFQHDMALAAYHLPLDAHPQHGNNAIIAQRLGVEGQTPFALHRGKPIGVQGRFPDGGIDAQELIARIRDVVGGREPLHIAAGPDRVRSIGIVSGAGTDFLSEAIAAGLDCLLTGEPAERAYGIARDNGVRFVAAGHHATEPFGVQRLGEILVRELGVRHEHLDVPNPI
jgi:dinuclear metal center YbgI/SA1388 family protein